MKIFFTLFCLLAFKVHAQDVKTYLTAFDNKVYSLKTKGVKDFVVDIESSKLTKQMNEQMIFGKVKKLVFRVYWTASPERMAIEVLGLPEGFKEVKEELKLSILSAMDNLLPIGIQDRFSNYKITAGTNSKEYLAKDQSGIAAIPTYVLKFDGRDSLVEVTGKKPVGSFRVKTTYDKAGFADGKWILKEQVTTSEENGQTMISTKVLDYGTFQGIGILEEVSISVIQKWENPEARPMRIEESLIFSNYKISSGEGLKYFLGDSLKK